MSFVTPRDDRGGGDGVDKKICGCEEPLPTLPGLARPVPQTPRLRVLGASDWSDEMNPKEGNPFEQTNHMAGDDAGFGARSCRV